MKHIEITAREDLQNDYLRLYVTDRYAGLELVADLRERFPYLLEVYGKGLTESENIQIVINKTEFAQGEELPEFLRLGVALCVTGTVVPSAVNKEGGVEINATQIELLGDCPADYPLQKKRHTLEFLRTMPHIRLRSNTFNAVFHVRSVLAAAIHEYFQQNGYVYVNTPLITGSDCEGAGEMFQVTTHAYGDEANYEDADAYYADDFFGQQRLDPRR